MFISQLKIEELTKEQITQFIFEGMEDDGQEGDCILVFGNRSLHRVKKAAQLYFDKRAPVILVSGSANRWPEGATAEAVWMRNHLIKMGVPEDKILMELEADNTTENVIGSAYVLQKKLGLHTVKRILAVSAPFHMKRCYLTLKTYMPTWIDYTLCPDDRPLGQKHNWQDDLQTEQLILKEMHSIIQYTKRGILLDREIDL
ncbi:YdcF family protein [Heyndrickxia acidicola]|uniref:YdcF family protein n=1 Tax=Heyndrickxia acidicola TaxID=209389 RepID=A0ABU6MQ34_9BACI|nr:YdcF family protein [Heyndrickxia acidicola]MED1205738.1 YdcF family protein [Heyndrickxia acidicola]